MQQTIDTTRDPRPATAETQQKAVRGYYLRSTPTNMGFNPVLATITITDQRLRIEPDRHGGTLLKSTLGALGALDPVDFPLCHIRSVAVHDKTVWGKRDVLRIEFDTDGREYLWVQPAHEWQAALVAARATAADAPYSTLPAVKNGVEASSAKSAGKVLLTLLGVVVALVLACVVIGALISFVR